MSEDLYELVRIFCFEYDDQLVHASCGFGLNGEKTLHHIRQLGGGLVGRRPLHQTEYFQRCHAIQRIQCNQEASLWQIQDDGQAAVHVDDEGAEVLDIELRSGHHVEKHVCHERLLPMQAHHLARGRCAPYCHPRSVEPTKMFLEYRFHNNTLDARYPQLHGSAQGHFPSIERRMHRQLEPVALRNRQIGRQQRKILYQTEVLRCCARR